MAKVLEDVLILQYPVYALFSDADMEEDHGRATALGSVTASGVLPNQQ